MRQISKSWRQIVNLMVLCKLLESLVACQLVNFLDKSRLLPDLQSAYQAKTELEKPGFF